MKNIFIIAMLFSLHLVAFAQDGSNVNRINGNECIKHLLFDRFQYNKSLIKHSTKEHHIPKSKSVLENNSMIVFSGYEYVIRNHQIVEIKGIIMSDSTLALVSEKLILIDKLQKECSEIANKELGRKDKNLQYIKAVDRQFFAALNQLSSITSSIAKIARKPNVSAAIQMAAKQINVPQVYTAEEDIAYASVKKL